MNCARSRPSCCTSCPNASSHSCVSSTSLSPSPPAYQLSGALYTLLIRTNLLFLKDPSIGGLPAPGWPLHGQAYATGRGCPVTAAPRSVHRRLDRRSEQLPAEAVELGVEAGFEGGALGLGEEGLAEAGQGQARELVGVVAEGLPQAQVLAGQVGVEECGIVGAHRDLQATAVELVEGMVGEVPHHAEAEVRGGTELERDAALAQLGH